MKRSQAAAGAAGSAGSAAGRGGRGRRLLATAWIVVLFALVGPAVGGLLVGLVVYLFLLLYPLIAGSAAEVGERASPLGILFFMAVAHGIGWPQAVVGGLVTAFAAVRCHVSGFSRMLGFAALAQVAVALVLSLPGFGLDWPALERHVPLAQGQWTGLVWALVPLAVLASMMCWWLCRPVLRRIL